MLRLTRKVSSGHDWRVLAPKPRPHRSPDTRIRLHRSRRNLHLGHRARIRIHQSPTINEILRPVHVPLHQRHWIRPF